MEHQISDIFQYASCKYRWYLCRVLNIDFDNIHTVTGTIAHTRTTSHELRKNSENEYEKFDVSVGNGSTLYGVCDAVLFIGTEQDGIVIPEIDEHKLYKVYPLEYKSQRLKEPLNHPVHLQCIAQAECLEYLFGTQISAYYLYYHKEHRRDQRAIRDSDRQELSETISEMEQFLYSRQIPPRTSDTIFCKGCSCSDYCDTNTCNLSLDFDKYLKKAGA